MIEFPFIGGSYTSRSRNLNAQQTQNLYVEVDKTGAKNVIALVGCPGMKAWKTTGTGSEVRNMIVYDDKLTAVVGNKVYQYDSDKTESTLLTLDTSSGWADIVDDGSYLMVFDRAGGKAYAPGSLFTGLDIGLLSSTYPASISSGTFQDGFLIATEADSQRFHVSDMPTDVELANEKYSSPFSWNASGLINGAGDDLVAARSIQRNVWFMGVETTEVWYYNADGTSLPFARNPGGFIRIGCGARRSIATEMDQLMFLDDKGRFVMKDGLQLRPVSSYQIDYMISTLSTTTDAVAFMYTQEGHTFYECSFPTGDLTVCYDMSTGMWHTRASGATNNRSKAQCSVDLQETVLVGDHTNGKIYEYDLDTYDDDGLAKVAIRAAQAIGDNNEWVQFSRFEVEMDTGVGNADVTEPMIMMDFSNDDGNTWSAEKWKPMGAIGEYGKRVGWNRLGATRKSRIFRVKISDAVKRNITKAWLS